MDAITRGGEDDWFVSVKNNTGSSVSELYVSPHNSNSWGINLIQNNYLENKSILEIDMDGFEEFINYDIRMDSSDGSIYIKEIIELSNNITVILTSADKE